MVKKGLIASVIIFFSLNTFAENYEVDINKIENSVIQKEKETELKFIENSNLGDTDYKKFITGEKKFKKKPTNEMTEDELLYLAFVARIKSNVNQILKERYKNKNEIKLDSIKINLKNKPTSNNENKQLKESLSYIDYEIDDYLQNKKILNKMDNNKSKYNNFIQSVKLNKGDTLSINEVSDNKYIDKNSNLLRKVSQNNNDKYNINVKIKEDVKLEKFNSNNMCSFFIGKTNYLYENTNDVLDKERVKITLINDISKEKEMSLDDKMLFAKQMKLILNKAYLFDKSKGLDEFKSEINSTCNSEMNNLNVSYF